MKSFFARTLPIALLVLTAGAAGISAQSENPRVISISGSAKVSVEIDYAELAFAIRTRDRSFEKAQTDNIKMVERVIKELGTSFGIKAGDIYTDDYSLSEYYEDNRDGERVRAGYQSITTMRVKLRDIARYKDMLIALLRLGVNGINSIAYVPKELAPYKVEGLRLAFLAARQKADELAKAAGTKIVRVQSIHEQATYLPGPQSRQMYAQTNMAAFESYDDGSGSGISIGDRTLTVEVSVVFEIQ